MKTDIEISQGANIKNIKEIAAKIGLGEDDLECYGKYEAKIASSVWKKIEKNPYGKLVLVTSINPTAAGEGKTTTSIGLSDAINIIGRKTCVALREPSMGPCFGSKGAATGGGYAQIIPMEDINLHFTGDFHAITSAHNLIAALLDNHIYQGNQLEFHPKKIVWRRVLDINDRALRHVIIGMGEPTDGVIRESGFDITVSSEIMAILCLSHDVQDLRERIDRVIVGYNMSNEPITCGMLSATGAIVAILKDAIKPNLVQTIDGTPAFVHGGPFANIAHGCSSLIATRHALKLAEYTVTEAGFGSDLGAEKFLDIKCPLLGKYPDVVVIVATIRALKMHGLVAKNKLDEENLEALKNGFSNLEKHIKNIQRYNLPIVVALNIFNSDTENEIALLKKECSRLGAKVELSRVWEYGGKGAIDLAKTVIELAEKAHDEQCQFKPIYDPKDSIRTKIEKIASTIYGADGVIYSEQAKNFLRRIGEKYKYDYPICIAKTEKSLSDNKNLLGCPNGFKITITDMKVMAGAEMVVAYAGNIMTMPGLPKTPRSTNIDLTDGGKVVGLE